ncbi:MAG: class I SAM-dependent methyltransferase [Methylocystis sp.]
MDATSLAAAEAWFSRYSNFDVAYLQAHLVRFGRTFDFAQENLGKPSKVLDIGCHWLHQSWFFAKAGHQVTGADAPNTLRIDDVQAAAKELGISLVTYTRLDLGQGLADLPDNEFDMIVFGEIIEHLAFNPLVFWKQVYRILCPGGRIVVTTPNSVYYQRVASRLSGLIHSGVYGIDVDDIFSAGTYGHHWKEFSIPELHQYFERMSPDFCIRRYSVETFGRCEKEERLIAAEVAAQLRVTTPEVDLNAVLSRLDSDGRQPYGSQILLEVQLLEKLSGISLSPPWLVE